MEKLVEIGILFDFYGKLLSNKQYLVIEFYYIHDLSLAEIGIEIDVTRQGVFDILKRAEKKLYAYEENLKLVEKFYSSHSHIKDILNMTQEILNITKETKNSKIEKNALDIRNICNKILENSREVI